MDFALAFSFPFQDEDWIKKIAIAGVLTLTVIGAIPVFGWSLVVTKRVISGETPTLPDWSDFAGYIILAIKGMVVGIALSIPIIVVTVPVSLATTLITDGDAIRTALTVINICLSCVVILYSIALAFVVPASYGRLAATDSIGEALNPGKLIGMIRAVPSAYLMAVLGYIVAGIVSGLGVILCIIGVFATAAYAMAVQAHLYGQAYKEAAAAGAI